MSGFFLMGILGILVLISGVCGIIVLIAAFQDGLLEAPVYTRPAEFKGMTVPDVLRSGDPKKIGAWQHEQAVQRTKERRKDLYEQYKKEY